MRAELGELGELGAPPQPDLRSLGSLAPRPSLTCLNTPKNLGNLTLWRLASLADLIHLATSTTLVSKPPLLIKSTSNKNYFGGPDPPAALDH